MDVHKLIKAERQLSIRDVAGLAGTRSWIDSSLEVAIRMFALADRDAPRQCSLVVVDAIVGDFQVVGPCVYVDAAASLGTVGHRQAVNARRVALETARERIMRSLGVWPAT